MTPSARLLSVILSFTFLTACTAEKTVINPDSPASASTQAHNQAVAKALPLGDQKDFEQARKGMIASAENLLVKHADGSIIWDHASYGFINGEAPASVNPSLWRQAKLNNINGLFKVTDGIYQLRGFDLSNMTLIEGDKGWIVVDPLTTQETAAAALAFARQHLGDKAVTAVIFTHSHLDHFGGVLGVVAEQDIDTTPVIAPEGFMHEATSENVIAGVAMTRRAMYMYGMRLPRDEQGHVGSGLGKQPALGNFGILAPTQVITETGQTLTIDGVDFVFQNVPGSEAPAELTFYLPQFRAYGGAEMVSRNMHNLYTLRGAKVRDALMWSRYIDESLQLFGAEAELYFGSHHWPIWGQADVVEFLKQQRDTYKFIHDQTVRYANQGLTPGEIAEKLALPDSLAQNFANRGYYGTVKHNARAVYQFYFGWYDGNPAHLDPLPDHQRAEKYVQLLGGIDAALAKIDTAVDAGDYRWAAELLNHVVFANPDNKQAKEKLASVYRQLGYQAESGPWRDVYLSAAFELLNGAPDVGVDLSNASALIAQTPISNFFDSMAVKLKAEDAEDMTINIVFTDTGETYVLTIENAVLHHYQKTPVENANATLKVTHNLFLQMLLGKAGLKDTLFSDQLSVEGSSIDLLTFFSLFEKPAGTFNIVTP